MIHIRQFILKTKLIYLVITLIIHQLSAICVKNENRLLYQGNSGITLISLFNSFDFDYCKVIDIDNEGDGPMQGQSEMEDEIKHFESFIEARSSKITPTFRDATLIYHVEVISQHFFEIHSPPPELLA